LCDRAAALLQALRAEFPHVLHTIDIDSYPAVEQKWCCHIPVVLVDGGNRVALRILEERLRRAFSRARQRSQSIQPQTPHSATRSVIQS
jgi:hypothetical protein